MFDTALVQGNEVPTIECQDGSLAGCRDCHDIAIGRCHFGRASRMDRLDIVPKISQRLDNWTWKILVGEKPGHGYAASCCRICSSISDRRHVA